MERFMQGVTVLGEDGTGQGGLLEGCFAAGELTLVAGCTGSGKSTLLQLLAGIRTPASGWIGEGTADARQPLQRKVLLGTSGYVHQNPEQMFFLPTVREEILYGLKKRKLPSGIRRERLVWASARCGVGEELWERSAFTLSGGEKRRVALAAAAAVRPAWLLLDEPTAGLDPVMAAAMAAELASTKHEQGKQGGGIVVASHELDLFLPLADRIILLRNGASLGQWSHKELLADPSPLVAAGLEVPDCFRLAALTGASSADAEAIAMSIAEKLEGSRLWEATPVQAQELRPEGEQSIAPGAAANPLPASGNGELQRVEKGEEKRFARLAGLDPRVKWLLYGLFSLSLLIAPHWGVTALGGVGVAVLAKSAGIPAGRWLKPVIPFTGFLLAAFAISGLQLSFAAGEGLALESLGFSVNQGLITLKRLTPLLPVLGGGVLFNVLTPPLSIQKGLQELLRRIPGIRRGAETAGLAVALLFRFIRYLPGELTRMALLASVRGGTGGSPGKLKLRQLPAFFIPLLLSLLHYAEELSFALTARGYIRGGAQRTNATPLRWRRSDGAACLAGLLGIAAINALRILV